MTEVPRVPADPPDTPAGERRRARGQLWAALMQRAFGFDVLACPRCGGRLQVIALIEEAAVIRRILQHLGVPTEVPAPQPARAPPLLMSGPEAAPWDDGADAPAWDPC